MVASLSELTLDWFLLTLLAGDGSQVLPRKDLSKLSLWSKNWNKNILFWSNHNLIFSAVVQAFLLRRYIWGSLFAEKKVRLNFKGHTLLPRPRLHHNSKRFDKPANSEAARLNLSNSPQSEASLGLWSDDLGATLMLSTESSPEEFPLK